MIEELYKYLRINVASVSGRVYPMIMPQDCVKPAIVYSVVNNGDQQNLNDRETYQEIRFQIDIYANSYMEAQTISTEVKSDLYDYEHFPYGLNSRDGFDSDTELFRQIIEFKIRN